MVTLSRKLIAAPQAELWPEIRRRADVAADVEALLPAPLAEAVHS